MPSPLFSGPTSLRDPRERIALVLTVLFVLPAAYSIGLLFNERIAPEAALFIIVAMLYVTLARGRLIGSSVMIHEAQYPHVFSIVKRACAALELPMPLVFVREDYQVPIVALGFGEPYALVISSHWIEHFEDDELAFIVGRELGHIAAGHTRFLSLLSINGNENAVISLIFGGWLRSCTMTCDRVGLLACGSLDAATRAIAITSFHHFGRQIDMGQFAEQGREIASDGALRLGEWLGGEPYATRRIAAMAAFMQSPLYAQAKAWFDREIPPEPPSIALPPDARVHRRDCAGLWRRGWAFTIDFIIVGALIFAFQSHGGANASVVPAPIVVQTVSGDDGDAIDLGPVHVDDSGVHVNTKNTSFGRAITFVSGVFGNWYSLGLLAYFTVLVGFAGQSFGMMIAGLRVVRNDFRPAGIWRTLFRYAIVVSLWGLIIILTPFMRRVMIQDKLTGTRLIRAERVMARAALARS